MADFYGTLAEALVYHNDRGNSAWAAAASDAIRTAALVRGTQYIDGRYSGRWPGTRTDGRDQPLAWPRTDAEDIEGNEIDEDEVPIEVEHATYEAALRELATPGSLSPDYTASERVVREKVDVLEVQYSDRNSGA